MTTKEQDSKGFIAEARRDIDARRKGYRERALVLFPHICGHCGREFSGKNLRELTVHHRDHNHDNNPPDGSNWELLCIYCHDNEHARDQVAGSSEASSTSVYSEPATSNRPFANLAALLAKDPADK